MESRPIPPTHAHLPSSFSYLPSSILVRGVNWLGDAVMTTPALQRLRERFPEAHITLLTPEKHGKVWLHHPGIDEVMTFATDESPWSVALRIRDRERSEQALTEPRGRSESSKTSGFVAAAKAMFRLASKRPGLPVPPFDLALVLPNSPRSALEVWLAR